MSTVKKSVVVVYLFAHTSQLITNRRSLLFACACGKGQIYKNKKKDYYYFPDVAWISPSPTLVQTMLSDSGALHDTK